ncbi:MAG: hypothetical protein K6T83_07155 [Alicyclobacillus sp.]|nr:hypothetical protein [Alicyclobacillus sp.]
MRVLMFVDSIEDIEKLSYLKSYFGVIEDFGITVLYVSDPEIGLAFGEDDDVHYILPDQELVYKQQLEEYASRVFLHWLANVKFRHEVGDRARVIKRVMREERAYVLAICWGTYRKYKLSKLRVHEILFEECKYN